MRKNQFAFVGALVFAVPAASFAITVRDDVTTAQSEAYGAQSQFQSVGQIAGASGVLIAPNWVLTAYHVAGGATGNPGALTFTINGSNYAGAEVVNLAPSGTSVIDAIVNGMDLTLVRLSSNVAGVQAAQLFQGNVEKGNTISVAGFGLSGHGTGGQVGSTGGVKRAMRNVIDEYFAPNGVPGEIDISATRTGLFASDFDDNTPATNQTGTSNWLNFEGNLSSGDSGGGAFIEQNGQFYLAGINSAIGSVGQYGDLSFFTSASFSRSWIENTTGVPEPGTIAVLAGIGAMVAARRKRK